MALRTNGVGADDHDPQGPRGPLPAGIQLVRRNGLEPGPSGALYYQLVVELRLVVAGTWYCAHGAIRLVCLVEALVMTVTLRAWASICSSHACLTGKSAIYYGNSWLEGYSMSRTLQHIYYVRPDSAYSWTDEWSRVMG